MDVVISSSRGVDESAALKAPVPKKIIYTIHLHSHASVRSATPTGRPRGGAPLGGQLPRREGFGGRGGGRAVLSVRRVQRPHEMRGAVLELLVLLPQRPRLRHRLRCHGDVSRFGSAPQERGVERCPRQADLAPTAGNSTPTAREGSSHPMTRTLPLCLRATLSLHKAQPRVTAGCTAARGLTTRRTGRWSAHLVALLHESADLTLSRSKRAPKGIQLLQNCHAELHVAHAAACAPRARRRLRVWVWARVGGKRVVRPR